MFFALRAVLFAAIGFAFASVGRASCGYSAPFLIWKSEISADEPVVISVPIPGLIDDMALVRFEWVDESGASTPPTIYRMGRAPYLFLIPPQPRAGGRYRLRNNVAALCASEFKNSHHRLCVLGPGTKPEREILVREARTEPVTPALRLTSVHRYPLGGDEIDFAADDPVTGAPDLLVVTRNETGGERATMLRSAARDPATRTLALQWPSGECGWYIALGFMQRGEIRAYSLTRDGVIRLGGWSVSLPAPHGTSPSRFGRLNRRADRAFLCANDASCTVSSRRRERWIRSYYDSIAAGGSFSASEIHPIELSRGAFPDLTPWAPQAESPASGISAPSAPYFAPSPQGPDGATR